LVEVKPKAESIMFDKGTLPDLVQEIKEQKEDAGLEKLSTVEVLAERSASLHAILEGTRQFYRLSEERASQGRPLKYEEIYMDFRRSLELIAELQDINRQLLRLILERKGKKNEGGAPGRLAEAS
ncbi:MAG: hypothetical protein AAF399_30615, partial [Bacteroidota bacterium]